MRNTFIKTLIELAERDERILLLTSDLGYMALEPFAEKFPKRFFNVGIAEQNMGGGLDYGYDGISHYGHDDVGVLRVQPGITIVTPADYEQARSAFLKTSHLPGPIYYRLSKDDKAIVPELNGYFELGRAKYIGKGRDSLMIAMGGIAGED